MGRIILDSRISDHRQRATVRDSKLFKTLCTFLRVKHLTTTVYQLQKTVSPKLYEKNILPHLRHYAAENQRDWDLYAQPLTYEDDSQEHCTTGMTAYSLGVSRQTPG